MYNHEIMEEEPTRPERLQAKESLAFIIPILEKYNIRWVITGGFAAYAYGVYRPLNDIDIDIDTHKDDPQFKRFLEELSPYITQPLEHFVDQNYDNHNFEITYKGQVVDICPMADLKIFDKDAHAYVPFYNGYPDVEGVAFEGMTLPLLSKRRVIQNKEMLVWRRESDEKDIAGLKALL